MSALWVTAALGMGPPSSGDGSNGAGWGQALPSLGESCTALQEKPWPPPCNLTPSGARGT